MTRFVQKTLVAALAASFSIGSAIAAAPATPAGATAAPAKPSVPLDKNKISTMVGMDIGRGLTQIKDDIDIKVVEQALEATLKGEKTTLTEAEALAVRQDFMEKLRGEQQAKMKAEAETNQKAGDEFLAKNKAKKGVKTTASGLQYEVIKEGTGPKPVKTDSVTVNYVGTKIDGTEFDSSIKRGQPAKFPLANVIPGWTEGLQLMPVGSEYKFFIPAKLAYGEHGPPQIGPDATLVFDVTLISIDKPAPAAKPMPVAPKKD